MKKTILLELVLTLILTAGVAKADFIFGELTNLGPTVNGPAWDNDPVISADGLSLFFHSQRGGGYGGEDLWVTTRATKTAPWGTPTNLGPNVNSSSHDYGACISADDLSLFFTSDRLGGHGYFDLWVASRPTSEDPWGKPVNLGPTVNSPAGEVCPAISADGLTLFFGGYSQGPQRPGGFGLSDLWATTRKTKHDPWSKPANLGPTVNSASTDYVPSISADGTLLFFGSDRPGGYGSRDLWLTTRATVNDPWGEPVNLGPIVNSSSHDYCPSISTDGLMLFFGSNRPGGSGSMDLWQVSIDPVVDLNADGIVGSADMCMIVDHWGENYSLCDIGPTPLGDGIVDIQDLIALAEHLFEEVDDPTLIAHWPLDEAQGVTAYNNVTDRDGTLLNGPVWQPDGGIVAGTLQFDGTDDYVITGSVLDPADGIFSVVAWIQGGAPGQVVVSQADSVNWLMLDAEGKLMTELKSSGRNAGGPLLSEVRITDGNWHRIGFVWDGSYRHLHVDGVEVAGDVESLTSLKGSDGGLCLGAGSDLARGTHFSGLIDDIRIYNRAVRP